MALLSDQDRQTVAAHLATIVHPVRILFFTQTIGGPETAGIARQILDEVAGLNEMISLEEVNFILEKDRAAAFGIDAIPAIAILKGDEDPGVRFLGAPTGYEFMSLVEAIILVGGDDSGLTDDSKQMIEEQVTQPLELQVFVTPT
jgi:alkyl hydroperoxide reductase subunit AhpF